MLGIHLLMAKIPFLLGVCTGTWFRCFQNLKVDTSHSLIGGFPFQEETVHQRNQLEYGSRRAGSHAQHFLGGPHPPHRGWNRLSISPGLGALRTASATKPLLFEHHCQGHWLEYSLVVSDTSPHDPGRNPSTICHE